LEALYVCLRVLDADDYIIQSDEVVDEATIRPKNFAVLARLRRRAILPLVRSWRKLL
jgi:hypothetical protein